MCLILFSFEQHPKYRLILAANRDEFLDRPTRPAAPWPAPDAIIAGKDLKAGGTWLGVSPLGRFAAVTNYRDLKTERKTGPSRGHLVKDFVTSGVEADSYLDNLEASAPSYSGYNILLGTKEGCWWYSNISREKRLVVPGLYGLSNHFLDTPWPKVVRGKTRLAELIRADQLTPEAVFEMLNDETQAPDNQLPDTGVGLEWERKLSSMFIRMPRYGTRCSTFILQDYEGRLSFFERTYPVTDTPPFDVSFDPIQDAHHAI